MSTRIPPRGLRAAAGLAPVLLLAAGLAAQGAALDPRIEAAEKERIALIEKVKPSVVAVLAPGGQGGGSGVIISEDGFAITNFHVAAAIGAALHVGTSDGKLYDAVVVGLDRSGDLSLIKILPKKGEDAIKFPAANVAKVGDSDKLKPGDMTLALGNPQLLATDFNPTVTYGMVSGLHRYASIPHPTGALLEYCDCIQVDTAVNPGNSGGPLFNMQGEWVGINSAGNIAKSDRISSGVAYSISVNMIKHFMGHLRAGLECDHASLGALIEPENEEGSFGMLKVRRVLSYSDAARRGLDVDDTIYRFGEYFDDKDLDKVGFPVGSNINQYRNKLGLYPKGWRVPLRFKPHDESARTVLVRLMGLTPEELPNQPDGKPNPLANPPPLAPPPAGSEAAKYYEPKKGFANYYFNKQERDRVLGKFHKDYGDFSAVQGDWKLSGTADVDGKNIPVSVTVNAAGKDDKSDKISGNFGPGADFDLEPLGNESADKFEEKLKDPPKSGGLLLALFHYRQFLAFGEKGFGGDISHGGDEPLYLPSSGKGTPNFAKQRVMCEVIRTSLAKKSAKWYFDKSNGQLIAFEVYRDRDDDPCEVYLSDYKADPSVPNGQLPSKMEVRYKEKSFGVLNITNYKLDKLEAAK
jgi:S1-C subfamily serine protease